MYRGASDRDEQAGEHLSAASDALSLALLSLGGSADETRGERLRRGEQARSFLVEAVTALSRARIYVPGIRTYSLPFVMAGEESPDAELARLHQIATRLLWQNHAYLPARIQAKPLAPEEEAQLAVVLEGLSRHARMGRAARYRWTGAICGMAAVGCILGYTALALCLGSLAVVSSVWRTVRRGKPAYALPEAGRR